MIARPTIGTITVEGFICPQFVNEKIALRNKSVFNIGSSFPLLTIYSDEGDEQLSVSIGRDVTLYYEDMEELPEEGNYMTFDVSMDDDQLVIFLLTKLTVKQT